MSERTIDPTDSPFTDVDEVLADLALLEASLAEEISRLSRIRAPESGTSQEYRGRPVWWWRVMLVSWAWSFRTERHHPIDVLRGLRLALKQWDDGELVGFVDSLLMNVVQTPAA